MKLEHFGICVNDLSRAIGWYQNAFGFEVVKEFEKEDMEIKAALLRCGECEIELLEPYTPETGPQAESNIVSVLRKTGSNHAAVSVKNVEQCYLDLKSKKLDLITELIKNKFFFVRDSEGGVLEVKQMS